MKTKTLLKLADVLENFQVERANLVLPTIEKFNLEHWVSIKDEVVTHVCGVGVAALHPYFRARGFGFTENWRPTYLNNRNWGAVENFFGLTKEQARYLFSVNQYKNNPSPVIVANRIRLTVNKAVSPPPWWSVFSWWSIRLGVCAPAAYILIYMGVHVIK